MAEVLLGAFLQVLFDRLASSELLNFARREKVGDLINNWENQLRNIDAILETADDKASRGDLRVQPWLEDLRDLAYDIEDLLDDFTTEERSRDRDLAGKVCSNILRSCYTGLSPRERLYYRSIRAKMEEIDGQLSSIMRQMNGFGLTEIGASRSRRLDKTNERMTTSLPEPYVVGREDDEKAILELLTEPDHHHLSVIPIVGMGGVGKTTLAQSVFNNPTVVRTFAPRAWVCVSDNFDVLGTTRALLGSITGTYHENNDLDFFQVKLRDVLAEQKFLIVLDDYWNDSYNDWTLLRKPLMYGAKGSKIIVTTRLANVASRLRTKPQSFPLENLSYGNCLSLFAYHAIGATDFEAHTLLKPIGEKIVEKCGGLPLAAKTLGGLLRSTSEPSDWQNILDSEIWHLSLDGNDIVPALKLSYSHLPSHLKRCFAYCAVFPKDYEFDKNDLVLLWMAEGLLESGQRNPRDSMREQGMKYFDELFSRSFFQRSSRKWSRFVMHSLMHGLATSVASTTCLNVGLNDIIDGMSPQKVRHMSYFSKYYEVSARFQKCHSFKGLRTFLALPLERCYLSNKVVEDLLKQLKHLRALSLSHYCITEVPDCIGHLKHLRYLNLSSSRVRRLPESVCTLCNLETLILQECVALIELPGSINKLVNLRYLNIAGTPMLKCMPRGLSDLDKLEILPKFMVGRAHNELKLKELKHLQYLQEELAISGLHNVEEVREAKDARLNTKVGLTSLALEWDAGDGDDSSIQNDGSEVQVLEWLEPHPNIKSLVISGFRGTSFPSWVGRSLFVDIKHLRLQSCRMIKTLPSLGLLPSLKELEIEGMDALYSVGTEFFGNATNPFPSLEFLKFSDMPNWEVWSFSTSDIRIDEPFPQLIKLELRHCMKLATNLPGQLGLLEKLEIIECPLLEAPSPSMTNLSSLQELHLRGCNHQIMIEVSVNPINTLTKVCLAKIPDLLYLPAGFLGSLAAVEELKLSECDGLTCLWEDNVDAIRNLSRLICLSIENCINLQELPKNMNGLTCLRELSITGCSKLTTLPKEMMIMCSLEELKIRECGSLTSFPHRVEIPPTLKTLEIWECEKLQYLPEGIIMPHGDGSTSNGACAKNIVTVAQLDEIDIRKCPSLKPLQLQGRLLATCLKRLWLEDSGGVMESLDGITSSPGVSLLEEVRIFKCSMKSLTTTSHDSEQLRMYFTSLTELWIKDCPDLEVDTFPTLPCILKSLCLQGCQKIKSLPHQMHNTLTFLENLVLFNCSSIMCFPEGGLPLSLKYLTVAYCKNLTQPMAEWGLKNLTRLDTLWLEGEVGCLQLQLQDGGINSNFPPPPVPNTAAPTRANEDDWFILPSNLKLLIIDHQQNLVSLTNGLRNYLVCLEQLIITYCPKLRFLPKEGFPASLQWLNIYGCSESLRRKCSKSKKEKGQYYPLIQRIPVVYVVDK